MLVVKNTISAITQTEKWRLLWTIQAWMHPRLLVYSSKSCSIHGCLVCPTPVVHECMYSLLLLILSPWDHGWATAFSLAIKTQVLLVPLNVLTLCRHQCSKIRIVPSAGSKQAVGIVLWNTSRLLQWCGCKDSSKSPWVYRVGLLYTRNSGLVIHSFIILMTLNNLFPDDLNRDCFFFHHI